MKMANKFSFVHSIRFKLLLWFTAILMLVLTVFSIFIYFNQVRDLQNDSLGRLGRRLNSIQNLLYQSIDEQDGIIRLPAGTLQETDVFGLLGPNGQVLFNQGAIPSQASIASAIQISNNNSQRGELPGNVASWVDTNSAYGYVITPIFVEGGQSGYILLGSPLDSSGQTQRLLTSLLLGNLLTLAIALGGGFWLADRAMRPVRTITHAAQTISETDLNLRLNMKGKDELGELASTFDAMLSRLQAAFERQRQFVADASHELRTPLTIINLETSRALSARRTHREYERVLGIIRSENGYMSRLVNDLLTLARMDNRQVPLEMEPLDLSDVAVDAIDRLAPLAAHQHVKLETGNLPEALILGDRQSILQMISNLVENGIKYSTGDDRWVCIETGSADGCTWLRVSDNGPGIDPQHLPHLFDRFYRVDQARQRIHDDSDSVQNPTGSGLGLSITQEIARMHSGEVHVESSPKGGSCFEVRFKTIQVHSHQDR
jgi:heavy metal sensor kinase